MPHLGGVYRAKCDAVARAGYERFDRAAAMGPLEPVSGA